jgi:hypothetical protein
MSDELNGNIDPQNPPASAVEERGGASGQIDPAEYYRLQGEYAQMSSALERLAPHADRIKRMIEDPDAAQIFDNSLSAYEELRKKQQPQLPPELQPLYDKVSKLDEYAETMRKRDEEAALAPQREAKAKYDKWIEDAKPFAQRLLSQHPELNENGGAAWTYLEQSAAANGYESFDKTWKREGHKFIKDSASAPPTSLRADSGEIGIPDASRARRDDSKPVDFRAELLKRLKATG